MKLNLIKSRPPIFSDRFKFNTSDADKAVARKYGWDYFDGAPEHGYAGYIHSEQTMSHSVPALITTYRLNDKSSVLDVGCAKGFFLYDLQEEIPSIVANGLDISDYAINKAPKRVRPYLQVGDMEILPYPDEFFDLTVCFNSLEHLKSVESVFAVIKEMKRVSTHQFLYIRAWKNAAEKRKIISMNKAESIIMGEAQWEAVFKSTHYKGDYQFFGADEII